MHSYKRMKRDSGDEITRYQDSSGECDLAASENSDGNGILVPKDDTETSYSRKQSTNVEFTHSEQTASSESTDTKPSFFEEKHIEDNSSVPKKEYDSDPDGEWDVTAVLGPEFTEPISETEAVIDIIVDKKETSRLVRELNDLNPIPSLQHLKRVRSDGAVILSLNLADAPPKGLDTRGLRGKPEVVHVPSRAPLTRQQFTLAQILWPCNFHPRRDVEATLGPGAGVPPAERQPLRRALRRCLQAMMKATKLPVPAPDARAEAAAAMMGLWTARVDPVTTGLEVQAAAAMMDMLTARKRTLSEVEAAEVMQEMTVPMDPAASSSTTNPMSSATRIVHRITGAAECAGTSSKVSAEEESKCGKSGAAVAAAAAIHPRSGEVIALAVDCRDRHPLQHAAMRLVDLVARAQGGGAWRDSLLHGEVMTSTAPAPGPRGTDVEYLCTGLDAVLTREPCPMCAMALTHARFRRVFYAHDHPDVGALHSRARLHTIASLNHRIRVYRGLKPSPFEEDNDGDAKD